MRSTHTKQTAATVSYVTRMTWCIRDELSVRYVWSS